MAIELTQEADRLDRAKDLLAVEAIINRLKDVQESPASPAGALLLRAYEKFREIAAKIRWPAVPQQAKDLEILRSSELDQNAAGREPSRQDLEAYARHLLAQVYRDEDFYVYFGSISSSTWRTEASLSTVAAALGPEAFEGAVKPVREKEEQVRLNLRRAESALAPCVVCGGRRSLADETCQETRCRSCRPSE